MLPLEPGIYRIINLTDGKFYVGSAACIRTRWFHHRKLLRRGKHSNVYLQRAWHRDGEASFSCEVLELCARVVLLQREQAYLDSLRPPYNLTMRAGSMLGHHHSVEARAKMSVALRGRVRSAEHRAALSRAWHTSEKAKSQLRMAQELARLSSTGRVDSQETRRRRSLSHLGKKLGPMPQHIRDKISATKRARRAPPAP